MFEASGIPGLSGAIPDSYSNLAELQELYIPYNPALSGTLPDSLTALHKLTSLNMQNCNVSGSRMPSVRARFP